jgi:hypothetical protein
MFHTKFFHRSALLILIIIFPLILSGQYIDRQILSSVYQNIDSDLKGEWVLGETVVGTLTKNDLTLSQGFLQGEPKTITGVSLSGNSFFIKIFPNPTSGWLTLQHNLVASLDLGIYDIAGKFLLLKKDLPSDSQIDLTPLPLGTYFFKYQVDGRLLETARIVKM